jgi:hypothetical protein
MQMCGSVPGLADQLSVLVLSDDVQVRRIMTVRHTVTLSHCHTVTLSHCHMSRCHPGGCVFVPKGALQF